MKRYQRPMVAVVAAMLASTGLVAFAAAPANAAVFGGVVITVAGGGQSGTDATAFGGSVNANCPAGTLDSNWFIDDVDDPSGSDLPRQQAFLGPGVNNGVGTQSFSNIAIANLKTNNGGSFSQSGPYKIRFECQAAGGVAGVTDTYEAILDYVAGGAGSFSIRQEVRNTATTLTATPAGPFELGTLTDLAADVTPASGADNPTGSVEFFRGTTSLGIDNTLSPTGAADLAGVSLPQGSNSITAVFTPAAGSNLNSSTSPPVVVEVTAVAARPTTSVLAVDIVSGAAYQNVTFSCTVTANTGQPNGTARFLDNGVQFGSAPVVSGAVASFTTNTRAPGAHSFVCDFLGSAPYNNSVSNTVAANYDSGIVPGTSVDEQTVTVIIPDGAIVITTPYTPTAPLALGAAVLDATDSTYSASATFNDIVITDTRAGNVGWTATVVAGSFSNGTSTFGGEKAGLTGLVATQVPGNALQASNVVLTNTTAAAPGLGTPTTFATYAAGLPTGTADMTGTFSIDQVPTSVTAGTYTSTVTFTAV